METRLGDSAVEPRLPAEVSLSFSKAKRTRRSLENAGQHWRKCGVSSTAPVSQSGQTAPSSGQPSWRAVWRIRGRHPSLSCVFNRVPCSADRSSRYLGISLLQLLSSFRYQIIELLLAISVSSADDALTMTAPCTVALHPSLVGGFRSILCHHGSRLSWESKAFVRWHQLRLAPPASTSEHR